ncbi:MAG: RloB family protein, partial [Opitutaceae bacterium]|nr:RloB family protein [Opitutaceae bacterium]
MNQREWWKESGSLVRPKPAARITCARPGDSILIVTEGTVTEPVYFQLLREDIKLTAVTVHIEPGDASHPRHVIETAARLAKEQSRRARKRQLAPNEPSKYDHVWAVIDTDVAVREGVWSDMRQLADARKIKLAHS